MTRINDNFNSFADTDTIVNRIVRNFVKPAVGFIFRVEANRALSTSYFKSHNNLYSVKGLLDSVIYYAANRCQPKDRIVL